jgi:hypothetical protein
MGGTCTVYLSCAARAMPPAAVRTTATLGMVKDSKRFADTGGWGWAVRRLLHQRESQVLLSSR